MGIHPEHQHWTMDHHLMVMCQGVTQEQADLADMVHAAENAARVFQLTGDGQFPYGSRLEMGVAALSALQRMVQPSFAEVLSPTPVIRPDLPVVLVDDVETPRCWRLVIGSGVIGDGLGSD